MVKHNNILKKIFFPSLFVIIYVILCSTVFFGSSDITEIGTTIGLQILLMILGLLALHSIDLQYKNKLYIGFSISGSIIATIARLGMGGQHAIFMICTHIIFIVYIRNRFFLRQSTKTIYLWSTAHQGLSDIAILLAITYTTTLRSTGSEININCNQLHAQTLGIVTHYIPTVKNNNQFNNILQKIDTFGTQSIGQILGTTTPLSGTQNHINQSTNSTEQIEENRNDTENLTGMIQTGLLSSVLSYQQGLINGVLNNQELIDAKVCDMTLQQINTISQKSDIKLIAFVLLILLLSFFMKSIMFIVGIINFLLLWILFKLERFKKGTIQDTIEKIDI